MTTPDFSDWATPVAVLDQSDKLYGGPGVTIIPGGPSVTLDTSRAQSVHIAMTPPPSGTVGSRYLLAVDWLEAGGTVGREILTLHSLNSYNGTNALFWQLPVYGAQMSLQAIGDDATPMVVVVVGSTREIPAQRLSRAGLRLGRSIMDSGAVTILAGGTQTYRIPPVERAITWGSSWTIANGNVDVRGLFNTQAGGMQTSRIDLALNPTGVVIHEDVPAPLIGLEITITNNDAGSHAGSLFVWDVS